MSHVRYIDKTREYYLSQGYTKPYQWAHFEEVPFTPLPKPLSECRVTLVSTSEISVHGDDSFHDPNEMGEVGGVYSIDTDTPLEKLYSRSHSYDMNATTLEDVNAFFPVTRLQELVASGRIGGLTRRLHATYNQYSQRRTREVDAVEVLRRCREDGADVAVCVPVCPVCHQTVSLISRHLEANGIPTVMMGAARDIVEHVGVARLLFTDFPLGSPCGEPFNVEQQRMLIEKAMQLLETATGPRTTAESGLAWSRGEEWKRLVFTPEQPWKKGEVEQEWLRKKEIYRKLKAEGESLTMVDQEREVVVYSTPLCAPCEQLKRYLTAHDVVFTVRDLMMDEEAADMMADLGIRSAPALGVNGTVIAGRDLTSDRIDELLGL